MVKIFSSYSKKLLILTLSVSIIPIVFFGSMMYLNEVNKNTDLIKNQLIVSSEERATQISDWINERTINVNDISKNPLVISATKKLLENNSAEELFAARFSLETQFSVAHQNHHNWLKGLRISDSKTGEIIFYTGIENPKFNLKYQKHFLDALEGITSSSEIYNSLEVIQNEYGSYEKGVPTLLISSPIQGEAGIIAILTARVDVFEITKNIKEHSYENFVSRDSYLINSNGVLLSKPNSFNKLWNMNLIDKRPELELSIDGLFPKNYFKQSTDDGVALIEWEYGYSNLLGEKVVGVMVPVKNTSWFYITELDHFEAFSGSFLFQSILLSLIGITILSVSGISHYYSSKLTQPIKNLTKITQQIQKGNLKVNVKSLGSDEIHELAVSVNSMAKSLRKSKESNQIILKKFQDLYENSPTLNHTINLEGKIINCNDAFANAFGYDKMDIVGKPIFDFISKNDQNQIKASFEASKKAKSVKSMEIIFQRKDGRLFPGILSSTNIYDKKNKLIGNNSIIQELSDIRNAQKEIQELKTKRLTIIGELTARIAHDMRNPLSIIKNSAELLKIEQKEMDYNTHAKWERLERGINRIVHQVDDVLDYVRKPVINRKQKNFSEILQDSLDRCEIPSHIKINFPPNDCVIFADPQRLEIVLLNLLMNAIQAMGSQAGTINFSAEDDKNNKFSVIEVSDNGPGIPVHLHDKIFDPLFTTREIGTGLGLPSCKNIIEHHGGSINVRSEVGKGTTFTIKLPTETEWEQLMRVGDKEKLTDFITSLNSKL